MRFFESPWLLDGEAGASAIRKALRQVVGAARPEDTVVFSFAGHGVRSGDILYLTPAGFNSGDTAGSGLAWSEIAGILGEAQARVVVFLGVGHAGLSGSAAASTNDEAMQALLGATQAPMLVFAASKGRQLSHEHARWGGGLSTHALVEALARNRAAHDLDGSGTIEVSELFLALKAFVAGQSGGARSPWLVRRDLVGDFALF